MSSFAPSKTIPRLLALTLLLSGLLVWGTLDRLAKETDRHFQAAAMEDCLTISNGGDDNTSDPIQDSAASRPLALLLPVSVRTACFDVQYSGARLLSGPGLPRAPPA